ncbi:MAG: hypothetical protein R3B47_03675 [Bacteroidia bacterium]
MCTTAGMEDSAEKVKSGEHFRGKYFVERAFHFGQKPAFAGASWLVLHKVARQIGCFLPIK